ncbi:hypothetical protein GWK47_051499 [Chionoecetes opilio]|uniref:Uncharacterized protein n=1 Tax=Chionoecetes opilio TaxID=41210 RepID=A0A8J5CSC3_CHIOP|nr:hypothetical protein GWK47_051499 [Chionoecetes opilio]
MVFAEAAAHPQERRVPHAINQDQDPSHFDPPHQDADRTIQELRAAAAIDPSYTRLRRVTSGFPPNRSPLHSSLPPYWKFRDGLYADGMVLYGQRIVVPAAHRCRTLARLHAVTEVSHPKRRAQQTVFWPGIVLTLPALSKPRALLDLARSDATAQPATGTTTVRRPPLQAFRVRLR